MNLDYVRSFHLIAHLRSVKDAAQRMHLSQPALSHQLAQLEEEFGVQLIDRNTKPLQLTEPGQMLLSRCQELFDWVEEVGSDMKSVQREMQGRLRIASPPGICHSWLMPKLVSFQKKFPKIDLQVELLDLSKVRDRLEQHRAEFIITVQQSNNSNFIHQPLFEEEMILICHKSHRLADSKYWTVDEITNAQWILFSDEDLSGQSWLEKNFGKKARPVHPNVLINDHRSIMLFLKQGTHLSVLPHHLLRYELDRGELVAITPHKGSKLINKVYCAFRAQKQIPQKIQTLLKHLKTPA